MWWMFLGLVLGFALGVSHTRDVDPTLGDAFALLGILTAVMLIGVLIAVVWP